MIRTMLKSKIHRATVTQADLHYVGSVTVDLDLMEAADLHPGDLVILISYGQMDDVEARSYRPRIVHVDAANKIIELGVDPAGAVPGMVGDPRRGDIAVVNA